MEISTDGFLLLRTVFALLQAPFYSLLSSVLKHPHPLKTSVCFSLRILRIFIDLILSYLPSYAMTIVPLSIGK